MVIQCFHSFKFTFIFKGRIRELEKIRAELAEKQLVLLQKEQELSEKEQTLLVLREEVNYI